MALYKSPVYVCMYVYMYVFHVKTYTCRTNTDSCTNETGPFPLCTFSVMGLSMCSSIFSESSPVRSKSGIINELSGLPNSVPTVRCSYTSFSWYGHTGHAYSICFVGKTLVVCAEFSTKIKFDLSTFIQKLLVFHKNYSTIYRSDKMSHFSYLEILISENLTKAKLDTLT